MKNKELRKKEALERNQEYQALSTTQKVLKLDLKLGGGKGAVRQRKKLAEASIKESEGRVAKVAQENKKPYQKPKRS